MFTHRQGKSDMKTKIPFDVKAQLADKIPSELKNVVTSVEDVTKAVMQSGIDKLNLVTREEFEIQKKVLLKTRERLEALETKLDDLLAKQSGQ